VLLAILFASKPDMILADELTNHLDKEAIMALSNILNRSKIPILLIDHNQQFLQESVFQYVFIPDNKERFPILYKGNYKEFRVYLDELQSSLQSQYNQLERKKSKLEDQSQNLQSLAKLYSESSKIGSMKKAVSKSLEKIENDPILANSDLSKSVKFKAIENKSKVKNSLLCRVNLRDPLVFQIGDNKTVKISDLEIYQGQRIRIIGKNGAGKSTLTKSLIFEFKNKTQVGFDQYISGKWDLGLSVTRKNIFMLVQLTDYPEGKTIENYLFENTDLDPFQFNSLLKSIELSKFNLSSFISTLSLGEFIRLQIAVMARMIHEIKLIILDEPGNFLDIFTQKALIDLLHKYHQSLIFITHDDLLASEIGFDKEFLVR
jgi:macrolide transport system ATP-binding/permease protein